MTIFLDPDIEGGYLSASNQLLRQAKPPLDSMIRAGLTSGDLWK